MKKIFVLLFVLIAVNIHAAEFMIVAEPPFTVAENTGTTLQVRVYNQDYTAPDTAEVPEASVELRLIPDPVGNPYNPANSSTYISLGVSVTAANGICEFGITAGLLTEGQEINVWVTKTGYTDGELRERYPIAYFGDHDNIKVRAQRTDLNVTYIERTPRYYNNVADLHNPLDPDEPCIRMQALETPGQKKWPDVGEAVTYTAHMINKGDTIITGFDYEWKETGNNEADIIISGTFSGSVVPGQEITLDYFTNWHASADEIRLHKLDNDPGTNTVPKSISFTVSNTSPAETIDVGNSSDLTVNNSLIIGTHDLTIVEFVETGLYELGNDMLNYDRTYSFEDYLQFHMKLWNERLEHSKYPGEGKHLEDGIWDRVRLDKIVIEEDTTLYRSVAGNPYSRTIDGKFWSSDEGDITNDRGYGRNGITRIWGVPTVDLPIYEWYMSELYHPDSPYGRAGIDHSLIHEWAHQLGLIDNGRAYPSNIEVLDLSGTVVNPETLPRYRDQSVQWGVNHWYWPGDSILGGGDTTPYYYPYPMPTPYGDLLYFNRHDVGGLNTDYLERRGYYGNYNYDTPDNTYVRVVDSSGNPLENVEIRGFQKRDCYGNIDNTPEFSGIYTDFNGIVQLPNRTFHIPAGIPTMTETGHEYKDNPFGTIANGGHNGVFVLQVVGCDGASTVDSFHLMNIFDLNLGYWAGDTTDFVYTIYSDICPGNTVTPTPSITDTITIPPTYTITPTITCTLSVTQTLTLTPTPSITGTLTKTVTHTVTGTITIPPTDTITPTITCTSTVTETPTVNITPTLESPEGFIIYPNPVNPKKGQVLKFVNIEPDSRVSIYTLIGDYIQTVIGDDTGVAFWDCMNKNGKIVAPGIYYYVAENTSIGSKTSGKIFVVWEQ